MKAFFHRLHLGGGAKDKDRDAVSSPKEKFPPLPSWPPQEPAKQTATPTPTSLASFKPLPEVVPAQLSSQLSTRPLPPLEPSPSPSQPDFRSNASNSSPKQTLPPLQVEETSQESSGTNSDSAGRSSRKTNGSASTSAVTDVQQKVAFISPPQTPIEFNRDGDATTSNTPAPVAGPLKTTVSRFQAVYGKEPRVSASTGASSSKTDIGTTGKTAVKATSTRTTSPYLQKSYEGGSAHSLRSGTPYSQMSNNTSTTHILSAQSWSEVTEDDLVSHIGMRERTRQEVLFEIISSEERYVLVRNFVSLDLHPVKICSRASENER